MISDFLPHPLTPFPRPAQGQIVVDPAFGCKIMRITDAPAGHAIKPAYSTVQAWSEDGAYLILFHWSPESTSHELWAGDGSKFYRRLDFESITDETNFIWETPDTILYCSNYNGEPRLMRHHVSTGQNSLVKRFGNFQDWGRLLSLGGDPMWRSWGPNQVLGLHRNGNMSDPKKLPYTFVYDVTNDVVLGYRVGEAGAAPGPSGELVYSWGDVYDASMKWQRKLDIQDPGDHGCVGRDADGSDAFFHVAFDGELVGSLVVHSLDGVSARCIVGPSTGYPYPGTTTHVSAVAHKTARALVAVSIVGDVAGQNPLDQEILLADLTDETVYRLCHHRSHAGEGEFGYWAEPHCVIAPGGGRVLFGSDWGGGDRVDTYIVKAER